MKFRNVFLVPFLVGAFVCSPGTYAQSAQGRISGEVTDSSGGAVAEAAVTIENLATHVKRVLETSSSGEYVAPQLEPAVYSITVEAQGFSKVVREKVQLEVAKDLKIDFQLKPGQVTETVEVKDEAPLTESTNAVLNGVLSNQAINELPLQGRDFQNLLALHPGVQRTPGGGFHSTSSNGNRLDTNNYIIDGASDNDAYWGETVVGDAGVAGTPASFLPLDAITEFNTQEDPQAEFGQRPGVIVNIGLKSGSNDIHGTGYYFHRNSAFDARNYFNPVVPGDPAASKFSALLLHQFGASIGGPIIHDKWFYFANYEGIRDKVGNPFAARSPITSSLGGQNCDPNNPDLPGGSTIYDLCLAAARQAVVDAGEPVSPVSDKIAALYLPNPGSTISQTTPQFIDFDFNNLNRGDNVVFKTDYHLNSQNTFSGRFFYANTNQTEEDTIPLRPEFLSRAIVRTQVLGADWTYTPNSRFSNQLRGSYNRFWEKIGPLDQNLNPATAYGIDTGVTDPVLFGFPRIGISNFEYLGGNSSWPLWTTPSSTVNISDTASYTLGKHTLKFGGVYERGGVNFLRGTYGRGRIDFVDRSGFTALENFYRGVPRRGRILVGNIKRNVHMTSFGGYINDDFRLTRRVTINLGARYDVSLPIKEDHDLIANFDPDQGIVQVGKGIDQPYQTNKHDISPRLSVAWDVFGTGKTVVRAGGGIIYAQPVIRTFINSAGLNVNPTGGSEGVLPGNGNINTFLRFLSGSDITFDGSAPVFDIANGTSFCSSDPADDGSCDFFAVDRHLRTPYVANWTLNVQQALTPNTLLQVAYVATKGSRLYSNKGINEPNRASALQCLFDNSGDTNIANAVFDADFTFCEQQARPLVTNCSAGLKPCFPFVEFLTLLGNEANSNYHALQVTLTKRYAKGLYLLAGYTYGHAIDNATSNLASVPQNSSNYQADRGNGDYDIRHRFTLSATYEIPGRKSKLQMLEGWQTNAILTLEGGEPFTLSDGFNDLSLTGELTDRWNISGPSGDIHWFVNRRSSTACDTNVELCFFPAGDDPRCVSAAAQPELLPDFGCFVERNTVLTPPAAGTFGNLGRNTFRGPTLKNLDFSVSKVWRFSERVKMQVRGEFFNIFNHPNFDVFTIDTELSDGATVGQVVATPDVGVANPVIGSGGSRHIQLGLKFIW